jgi:HlyD family secretion protein
MQMNLKNLNLKYLFTLAVPVALAALGIVWMFDLGGGSSPRYTYDSAEVTRGQIRRMVSTSGPVKALVTVSVGSQLSGQIKEVRTDFNSEVKAGDELAVLDDRTFVAKVNQAAADLAAARASVTNQEAALLKAEAALRQAERAYERTTQLQAKGVSSAAALDTATRDIEVAKAEVALAKAQIEVNKANVLQKTAVLEQGKFDVERTRIRSPINGTVISRTVDVGQTVAASLQAPELFKIAQDLRRILIEAQVNEADVGSVREGNDATFTVDAYPERRFEGRVTQVRLASTEINSVVTYSVIIEAQNEDRRLFPGMTATVQIETDKRDGAMRVANDAIRFRPKDRPVPQIQRGGQGRAVAGQGGRDRFIEQVRDELKLDESQTTRLREELQRQFQAARAQGKGKGKRGGGEEGEGNARTQAFARIETALQPILTAEQRVLFDRWKKGRENSRPVVLWVLNSAGDIEPRMVRAGLADDQFTEILGGEVEVGDRVVVRSREVKR